MPAWAANASARVRSRAAIAYTNARGSSTHGAISARGVIAAAPRVPNRIIIGSVRWRVQQCVCSATAGQAAHEMASLAAGNKETTVTHALRFGVAYDFRN